MKLFLHAPPFRSLARNPTRVYPRRVGIKRMANRQHLGDRPTTIPDIKDPITEKFNSGVFIRSLCIHK